MKKITSEKAMSRTTRSTRDTQAYIQHLQTKLEKHLQEIRTKDHQIKEMETQLHRQQLSLTKLASVLEQQQLNLSHLQQRIEMKPKKEEYGKMLNKELQRKVGLLEDDLRKKKKQSQELEDCFRARLREIEGRVEGWEREMEELHGKKLEAQKQNRVLRMLLRNGTQSLQALAQKNHQILVR